MQPSLVMFFKPCALPVETPSATLINQHLCVAEQQLVSSLTCEKAMPNVTPAMMAMLVSMKEVTSS